MFYIDAPRVSVHRSVINTEKGDRAELYCNFETNPSGTVKWSMNGIELPISTANQVQSTNSRPKYSMKYPQQNTSVLIVSNVQQDDLGEYDCKVENQIGSENVTIELTFEPEPPQLQDVKSQDDGSIITVWHVRSLQELTEVKIYYNQKGVR